MATTTFTPGSYTVSGISPAQTGIAESFQAGLQANLARQTTQQQLSANEQLMRLRSAQEARNQAQEVRTQTEYETKQRLLAEERAAAIAYGEAGVGASLPDITTSPAVAPITPATPAPPRTPRLGLSATGAGTQPLFDAMQQVESANISTAVSPKGAVGLMQVMPATARDPGFGLPSVFDYARQMGVPVTGRTQAEAERLLKDPTIGRGYGELYMNAMLRRYDGDVATALVAYNAGPGFADRWLANGADPSRLPAETRDYVAKITGLLGGAAGTAPAPAPASTAPAAPAAPAGITRPEAAPGFPVPMDPSTQASRIREIDARIREIRRTTIGQQGLTPASDLIVELNELQRERRRLSAPSAQTTAPSPATAVPEMLAAPAAAAPAAGVQPTTSTPVQRALEEATVNDEEGPSRIYAVAPERIFMDQQTLVESRQNLEALAAYYRGTNNVAGLAGVREELIGLNREQRYLDGMTAIAAIQQENFGPIQTLLQQARPGQQIEIRPYTDGTLELFVNGEPSVVEGTGEYRPTWGEFIEHLQSLYDREYIANVLAATERVRAQEGFAYETAVKETAAMEREIAVNAAKAANINPNIEWRRDSMDRGYATYVTPDGSRVELLSVPNYPFEGIGGKSEPGPAILMLMPHGRYSQPVYIAPDGSIRAAQ